MDPAHQEVRKRRPVLHSGQPLLGVVFDADGVGGVDRAAHEGVGILVGVEGIDLELHLVAVGIGVVHRHRDAMMDTSIGRDPFLLQLQIVLEQIAQ